jgi:hypothetical protein
VPPQVPPVQTSLAVHSTPSSQPVPSDLAPPSMQAWAPDVQDVVPFLQALFGLLVHATPAAHATQTPAALHTRFVPQLVPGAFCVAVSRQVMMPVVQLVRPVRHGPGLVVHAWFAVHDPQLPLPSQTRLVPQPVPPILLPPSTQV